MKQLLVLLFTTLPFVAVAQREVVISFDLKNTLEDDTITLSWGANNKSTTPLITELPMRDIHEVVLPLNEPRVIIFNLKGCKDNGCEMLLAPGEDILISGKVRNEDNLSTEKIRLEGASIQQEYMFCIEEFTSGSCTAEEIVSRNRESFLGPLMMIRLMGRLSKANRKLYDSFSANAKQCYYGREVKDEVYPPTLVGDLAPTVTVINAEGQDKILSFTRHGNRYLLLDFWASWCEPCHKEVPNLKRIYDKYHSQGLYIIGISADRNFEDWKESLIELGEPWCNYMDKHNQAIGEYKVHYIPSIFIIDKDGNIIAEKLRGKELSDYIDLLFSKP